MNAKTQAESVIEGMKLLRDAGLPAEQVSETYFSHSSDFRYATRERMKRAVRDNQMEQYLEMYCKDWILTCKEKVNEYQSKLELV